jgi:hypothetical protein
MMALAFAAMTLALGALLAGRRRLAAAALALGFVLAIGLFLWEIWSPETGFRMPWLQVRSGAAEAA